MEGGTARGEDLQARTGPEQRRDLAGRLGQKLFKVVEEEQAAKRAQVFGQALEEVYNPRLRDRA